MSSNSGVIVNRSNSVSPFFQALKSRNSKSLPELYSSEVNTESVAQSRVEVESSSTANYGRTLRIELPRYGLLNKLYLHTRFGPASGTHSTTAYAQGVPFIGAMCIREARITYNGQTLQKTNGYTIVSDLWKHSSDREKKHLQEMIGGYEASTGTVSGVNTANKYSEDMGARSAPGGTLSHDGIQDFYAPLQFYFDAKHSPNRALDLSVLSSPVILEVDMEAVGNCWTTTSGGVTASIVSPTLDNVSALCYLSEMDSEVEKSYRALTYQNGGSPLTQLSFNTEHIVVASNVTLDATDVTMDIKLNQFTGSVYKLVVFVTGSAAFATGHAHRIRPGAISEIQLKATGTNIVNQSSLQDKESILESYHSGGEFYPKNNDEDQWWSTIICNPNNFVELNFKKPYDMSKVSASGSVAFGALSVPSLRVVLQGDTNRGQFGAQDFNLGANADIHVIAYTTSLMSYQTNASGSTNIRMIQN